MIAACTGFGGDYKPSNVNLTVGSMTTLLTDVETEMDGVQTSIVPWKITRQTKITIENYYRKRSRIMKAILALSLIVMSTLVVEAQSDEFQKTEFFVGYSYGNPEVNFSANPTAGSFYRKRIGHNGFNGSAVVNVSRYIGIKGDVSGTYESGRFTFNVPSGIQSTPTVPITFDAKSSVHNFLGGVQIKDNSTSGRLKPFAHAMIGAARRSNTISGGGFACILIIPCPVSTNETAFAGAFGGGLDVRLRGRVGLRLIQVDYNPIKYDAGVSHGMRLGVGLIF
jgi:hypothetical protein